MADWYERLHPYSEARRGIAETILDRIHHNSCEILVSEQPPRRNAMACKTARLIPDTTFAHRPLDMKHAWLFRNKQHTDQPTENTRTVSEEPDWLHKWGQDSYEPSRKIITY